MCTRTCGGKGIGSQRGCASVETTLSTQVGVYGCVSVHLCTRIHLCRSSVHWCLDLCSSENPSFACMQETHFASTRTLSPSSWPPTLLSLHSTSLPSVALVSQTVPGLVLWTYWETIGATRSSMLVFIDCVSPLSHPSVQMYSAVIVPPIPSPYAFGASERHCVFVFVLLCACDQGRW